MKMLKNCRKKVSFTTGKGQFRQLILAKIAISGKFHSGLIILKANSPENH